MVFRLMKWTFEHGKRMKLSNNYYFISCRKILGDSLTRPVSILGNEMNYIINHLIEKGLLPLILVSMLGYI